MTRLGATGRAAATYVVLAGLQRGISLFILPFITHAMSTVEYGAASMLSAASVVITALIAGPLIPLVVRTAARVDEGGPALLRALGMYCYLIVPFVVSLLAGALALFVPEILGVKGTIWAIELLAIGFQTAASPFALWVARGRGDLPRFVWISSISVVATGTSKLVFVVMLGQGVSGWVVSDLISAVFTAALAVCLVRLPQARPRWSHVRYALTFTLPLIPHSASLWALNSLSRPAMAAVSSFEQVGLLSFGLSLAAVAGLILAEVNAALLPNYSQETFPAPTGKTAGAVKWQLIFAFTVPALVGCGVAIAGRGLFAEEYWPSFYLTGVMLVGQAASGLYFIPMNYLTQTAALPRYSALASGAAGLVILLGISLFGRRYGAVGVSYVTVVGYLVMAIVALMLTCINRLGIVWRSWLVIWPGLALAALALVCSVAALASPIASLTQWTLTGTAALSALASILLAARRKVDVEHQA